MHIYDVSFVIDNDSDGVVRALFDKACMRLRLATRRQKGIKITVGYFDWTAIRAINNNNIATFIGIMSIAGRSSGDIIGSRPRVFSSVTAHDDDDDDDGTAVSETSDQSPKASSVIMQLNRHRKMGKGAPEQGRDWQPMYTFGGL